MNNFSTRHLLVALKVFGVLGICLWPVLAVTLTMALFNGRHTIPILTCLIYASASALSFYYVTLSDASRRSARSRNWGAGLHFIHISILVGIGIADPNALVVGSLMLLGPVTWAIWIQPNTRRSTETTPPKSQASD